MDKTQECPCARAVGETRALTAIAKVKIIEEGIDGLFDGR
jgi:hypothetical protein